MYMNKVFNNFKLIQSLVNITDVKCISNLIIDFKTNYPMKNYLMILVDNF